MASTTLLAQLLVAGELAATLAGSVGRGIGYAHVSSPHLAVPQVAGAISPSPA